MSTLTAPRCQASKAAGGWMHGSLRASRVYRLGGVSRWSCVDGKAFVGTMRLLPPSCHTASASADKEWPGLIENVADVRVALVRVIQIACAGDGLGAYAADGRRSIRQVTERRLGGEGNCRRGAWRGGATARTPRRRGAQGCSRTCE